MMSLKKRKDSGQWILTITNKITAKGSLHLQCYCDSTLSAKENIPANNNSRELSQFEDRLQVVPHLNNIAGSHEQHSHWQEAGEETECKIVFH